MDVDEFWSAVLDAFRQLAPVEVRRSRFAPKPAIALHGREIAHWEAPGVIDVRITASGWSAVRDAYADDVAVTHDPARRDWIELRGRAGDAERLRPLITTVVTSNQS